VNAWACIASVSTRTNETRDSSPVTPTMWLRN
jgi:hypothetical protein